MSSTAKRVGLGFVAAASIAGLALVAAPARAGKQLTCEMTGNWLGEKDAWVFQARYDAKDGADTFTGLYFNAGTKTTASVNGVADKGTWSILFKYTDPNHQGQTRELVGTGRLEAYSMLSVSGTFVYKQDGRQIGAGNFAMLGKCK